MGSLPWLISVAENRFKYDKLVAAYTVSFYYVLNLDKNCFAHLLGDIGGDKQFSSLSVMQPSLVTKILPPSVKIPSAVGMICGREKKNNGQDYYVAYINV